MKPLQTGVALSLTMIVFYSLCALAAVMWPDSFMKFMNSLAHGLDFRKLVATEPYTWTSFFGALTVLAVWGFAIGAFFAWLHNVVSGSTHDRVRP